MKIEQITQSVIHADEGKVLVRKSDGLVAGGSLMLGYNYYDMGYPVIPYVELPDDYIEVEHPDDFTDFTFSQPKRMEQMVAIINTERMEFNNRGLTTEQALAVQDLAPRWDIEVKVGMALDEGYMFTYFGELYRVLKAHTVMSHYEPSPNTEGLYEKVKE